MKFTNVSFGEGNTAALHCLKDIGKAFNDDLTAVTRLLINLHKVTPFARSSKHGDYIEQESWCLPFADSSSVDKMLCELDQLKTSQNLKSRASFLERIIVNTGISINNEAVSFCIKKSDIFFEHLETLWRENKFCDVKITIGETSFEAHKVVLAASSKYLSNMMDDSIVEFNEDELTADTFGTILTFMYTGKISLSKDNLLFVYQAADLFQMEELHHICSSVREMQKSASNLSNIQLDLESDCNDSNSSDMEFFKWKCNKTVSPSSDIPNRQEMSTETTLPAIPVQNGPNALSHHLRKNRSQTCRKNLVCPTCQARFSQLLAYKLHLLCHDEQPTYKCYKCNYADYTFDKIREHMKASHSEVSIETDVSTDEDAPPEISDTEEEPESCDKCKRTFRTITELKIHQRTHKKPRIKRTYDCKVCYKHFRSSSHLNRHMVSHTGERKYCCITCGKLFLKSDHLKRHEKIHTSERPFTCEKCGKTFRDKDHLKRHNLTHTQERPYFCEMCGKQFKDKSTLITHQKSHDEATISCEVCGKLFRSTEKLEVHSRKHTETKPHTCEVCGKKFPFKGRLKKHMLSHTDARPFHCETCGKQFRDSHSLRLHQKKHTGIGLHSCPECDKQFTNACHLRRHEKVHSGEKPHSCELCKRAFARLDNLEAHRRVCTVQQQMKEKNSQHGIVLNDWDPAGGASQSLGQLTKIASDDLLPPSMVKAVMGQSFDC